MNLRQIVNILTLVAALVINGLANSLPLNGITTGEISDSFPVLFTPAGYVFAIWGLIYLLLIGFTIYQALPSQRNNPRLERTGYWFAVSNLLNGLWIFLWHYGFFPLTLVVMLGLLGSLLVIYLRLGINLTRTSLKERFLVNLPFSVYLGWISVATIANTTIVLYDAGWNGWGIPGEAWTIAVLLVAAGLGATMMVLRRDVAYALVLVWAFIGIYVKQIDTTAVAFSAAFLAAVLLVGVPARLIWLQKAFHRANLSR